jgi:hypothetical protein
MRSTLAVLALVGLASATQVLNAPNRQVVKNKFGAMEVIDSFEN